MEALKDMISITHLFTVESSMIVLILITNQKLNKKINKMIKLEEK
jgi:hypothetical protein